MSSFQKVSEVKKYSQAGLGKIVVRDAVAASPNTEHAPHFEVFSFLATTLPQSALYGLFYITIYSLSSTFESFWFDSSRYKCPKMEQRKNEITQDI